MRKEQTGVLLAVLITAALLGGTHYVAVIRPAAKAEPAETTWIPLEPASPSSRPARSAQTPSSQPERNTFPPSSPPERSAQTPSSQPERSEGVGSSNSQAGTTDHTDVPAGTSERTDKIIQCHDPEIGEFFTNAATCEAADPHNRISIAEPLHSTPGQDRYSGQDYVPPDQQAGNSRSDR
jgi:hypothetical protein